MVGQANFTHKELQNKNCNDIQNMLLTERDINWNNIQQAVKEEPLLIKKGWCWVNRRFHAYLKGENREYVDRFILLSRNKND